MKKLKLKENEVVHCATLKQAKKVLKIAHELGFTWRGGESYIKNDQWNDEKENTCFCLNEGLYDSVEFYKLTQYIIITSKEFIKRHKKASLKKRIKALEAIVNGTNDSVNIINSKELEYTKGWYKATNKGNKAFLYFNGTDFLYGINYKGEWEKESFVPRHIISKELRDKLLVKATHAEIEQRLIEEANKRGFKGDFEFLNNTLYCNELVVLFEGIWSENEIIEEACKEAEQPQIGDVVKAWDKDKSKFVYGVYNGREEYEVYYVVGEVWHENIEKVTEISINDFKK